MKREYIKGDDNEISDSLSRLCAVSDKTQYLTLIEEKEVNTDDYLNLIHETLILNATLGALAEPRILNYGAFNILTKVHNSYIGHLGVERTLKRLKRENITWEGMRLDIMSFINSIVERSNRETMRHIKSMVFELNKRNSWNKYLPIAQRIMNLV